MKYNKFQLKNFKGIKQLDIEIDKKNKNPITLVGLNESGKTTILEGIHLVGRHITNIIEKPGEPLLSNEELQSIIPLTTGGFFTDDISIGCTIKDNSDMYRIAFIYTIDNSIFDNDNDFRITLVKNDAPVPMPESGPSAGT